MRGDRVLLQVVLGAWLTSFGSFGRFSAFPKHMSSPGTGGFGAVGCAGVVQSVTCIVVKMDGCGFLRFGLTLTARQALETTELPSQSPLAAVGCCCCRALLLCVWPPTKIQTEIEPCCELWRKCKAHAKTRAQCESPQNSSHNKNTY